MKKLTIDKKVDGTQQGKNVSSGIARMCMGCGDWQVNGRIPFQL